MALVHHVWWAYDQERELRRAQDPLGNAAHRPALYATVPMCSHRDEITTTKHSGTFRIFPILCHSDECRRHIRIDRHRPGDRKFEVRHSGCY